MLKEGSMIEVNKQRKDYLNWDEYFMGIAVLSAMRSKDPNTQVGACVVKNNRILSIGYNGTPNGFEDKCFPWGREGQALKTKYPFVCHAEMNAISNFEGTRKDLEDSKLYVTLFPCNECAKLVIQSGIKEVIYLEDKYKETDGVKASKIMFEECKVKYTEFPKEKRKTLTLKLN
jgi:dCMP deaminase